MLTLGLATASSGATDYPKRPIRYVVASPAGTVSDVAARAVAQQLAARLGQPVIVENKPGAGGLIAANAALSAAPDGHTILGSSSGLISQPALSKGFNYDLGKDLKAITTLAEGRMATMVKGGSPLRTIEDLVAHMKAHPGKINVGVGSSVDILQVTLFRKATETEFELVRYPSGVTAQNALVSGEIDVVLGGAIPQAKPLVDAGKLRFISVNGTQRDRLIPDVPALGESSLRPLQQLSKSVLYRPFWVGIAVSSQVPGDIVKALYAATRDAMKDPEIVQRFQAHGLSITDLPTPDRATADLVSGATEFSRVMKEAGIQPN
ncbi:MAG TPA: tripartite tricarboxylate transporter substrate binding protein [Ramlibacter sp.]|nr:tripartite tricarboxylate transporter substrate binding protein [Ramlibacter sp.]